MCHFARKQISEKLCNLISIGYTYRKYMNLTDMQCITNMCYRTKNPRLQKDSNQTEEMLDDQEDDGRKIFETVLVNKSLP
jgi:hypothetical protein